MIRKTRNDKKDTICKHCGHKCSTPQKLQDIQEPIQEPIQTSQIIAQKSDKKNRDYISQEKDENKCSKTENLNDCITLCHDLKQYDPEAVRLPTKDKLKDRLKAGPEPKMQQELSMAVKRRAIAVHWQKFLNLIQIMEGYMKNGSAI
ncbi:hypothetical protein C2G38_2185872 [Gigaspora rosea]|uniref:Uncharacterized protein n=1 Tax=Gigaspora rosea TaxID=44941 RepID=A0A397V9H7_9GLOM|nr:hypothetical protein C2G38_2185872 [Gigaspora rosea]